MDNYNIDLDNLFFFKVRPLMKASFQNVLYTGPLGTAMIPKVFSNLLCAVNIIAAAEAMMVAKKAGTVNQNLEFHPEIIEQDLARCFKVGLESKKSSLLLKGK